MIIYNVTIKVDLDIHTEWLIWMQEEHIPKVLDTKKFFDYKIAKLLDQDESDGITYAIQYFCNNLNEYNDYKAFHAPALQADVQNKYGNKFVAFRTIMEVVK